MVYAPFLKVSCVYTACLVLEQNLHGVGRVDQLVVLRQAMGAQAGHFYAYSSLLDGDAIGLLASMMRRTCAAGRGDVCGTGASCGEVQLKLQAVG